MKFTAVSASVAYACGVTTAGAAYCWGANDRGQLGDGTTTDRSSPARVVGRVRFASVSTGNFHTCGLTTEGAALCWGLNEQGQLGDGTESRRLSPVGVAGGLRFSAVSAGGQQTCGVTSGSAAYCWGDNNFGELGDGTTTSRLHPVRVKGDLSFIAVSAGSMHTCGVTASSAVYCWGSNFSGQLGDGTKTGHTSPVRVTAGPGFASVSAGVMHTCAMTGEGAAYCWGLNRGGQLGDGTTGDRSSPVPVTGGMTFVMVRAGGHTCGLTKEGAAYCWGGGDPTPYGLSPALLTAARHLTALDAGTSLTCGVTVEGAAECWGSNERGQLGKGTFGDQPSPAPQAATLPPAAGNQADPLSKLAGDWDLRVFVVGAGQFGGPQCGKSVPGRRMLSVRLASAANGAVSFTAACDNGSEYSFVLGHDSAMQAYVVSVKSAPGISVQNFPLAYVEGQGWQGQRDSITAMITPIEGRLWRGWMIAVLPTAGVGHEDDLKQPFVRGDLTRAK